MSLAPPSGTFALVIPRSLDAARTVKWKANRFVRARRDSQETGTPPVYRDELMIKLEYRYLAARYCLSFGTSAGSHFRFPAEQGVDAQHFILHIHDRTGTLQLTDTSQSGLILYNDQNERLIPLNSCTSRTYSIKDRVILELGFNNRYRFLIAPLVSGYTPSLSPSVHKRRRSASNHTDGLGVPQEPSDLPPAKQLRSQRGQANVQSHQAPAIGVARAWHVGQ